MLQINLSFMLVIMIMMVVLSAKERKPVFAGIMLISDDKTEEPTAKKLSDSRKKGQVAKSTDLNSAMILLVILMLMSTMGDYGFESMYRFLQRALTNINIDPTYNLSAIMLPYSSIFISSLSIVLALIMVTGIVANLIQSGFIFTTEPLKMKFNKLNPIEGFKNIFSKKSLVTMIKTLMKLVLVSYIAYGFINDNITQLYKLPNIKTVEIFDFTRHILISLITRIALVLLVLGVLDFMFQKFDFKKNLRMTKQEVKEEYKQMEGDPHIKSQRRQKARALATSRMMADVKDATVVITNPTHIAVAIRYDQEQDDAPKVLAMGADLIAQKIKDLAREHEIPVVENIPLARLLFKKAKVGKQVPVDLYKAVAQILAIIYRTNEKYSKSKVSRS